MFVLSVKQGKKGPKKIYRLEKILKKNKHTGPVIRDTRVVSYLYGTYFQQIKYMSENIYDFLYCYSFHCLSGSRPSPIGADKNDEQISWNSNMAMASMVPNVAFLLLNASFGHHFKTTPRLLVSLIFVILLFGVTCAMTKVETDQWQDNFWTGTIISIVIININSAIFQGKYRFI